MGARAGSAGDAERRSKGRPDHVHVRGSRYSSAMRLERRYHPLTAPIHRERREAVMDRPAAASSLGLGLVLVFSLLTGSSAVDAQVPPFLPPPEAAFLPPVVPPRDLKEQLAQMSAGAQDALAAAFGVTEIAGKPTGSLGAPGGGGGANAKKLNDVAVGARLDRDENEPTVAANPKETKHLVAGSHFSPQAGNKCVAYRSEDRGATWSSAFVMPHLTAASTCSDPVLAYAPDGSRAYYSYMDIKVTLDLAGLPAFFTQTVDFDIVVSRSNDNGVSWSGPVVALDGNPYTVTFTPCPSPPFPPGFYCGVITESGYAYDKNWIGTHNNEDGSNYVYVSATRFDTPGPPNIASTRSTDKGLSWSAPVIHDTGVAGALVQGSRPVGGPGGEVIVAWYHSGADGWLAGRFQIRTRRSSDHGVTWDSRVIAADDTSELPFWLGPFTFYKRWWGAMFPDVEFDAGGAAHIAFTHDPSPNGVCPVLIGGMMVNLAPCSTDTEDGDIRYITSSGPPYTSWTAPETVNDDGSGRAQGYAALVVQHGSVLHAIWEDTRLGPDIPISDPSDCFTAPAGPCLSPNVIYDIFCSRKTPGNSGWFTNFRVNELASTQDFIFTGDYTDLAANNTLLFGIWTDRRHQTNIFQGSDNIFGSRIIAGGGGGH
jgi:hypothetical protein